LTVAACGDRAAVPAAAPLASATPVATVDACSRVRPASGLRRVPGLIAPAGAVSTKSTRRADGALQVDGFVPLSPTGFLRAIEQKRGVKVYFRETEGHESEALLGDGRYRNFWKVLAVCPQGSRFLAVVLEEPGE